MLAGLTVTAEVLNMEPTTYVPALTATSVNPTLGTGSTAVGWYYRIGRLIVGEAQFRFGSGMAGGTGSYLISLPVAADMTFHRTGGLGIGSVVGNLALRDNDGLATSITAAAYLNSSTTVALLNSGGGNVNPTDPWTWAASDALSMAFAYIVVEP